MCCSALVVLVTIVRPICMLVYIWCVVVWGCYTESLKSPRVTTAVMQCYQPCCLEEKFRLQRAMLNFISRLVSRRKPETGMKAGISPKGTVSASVPCHWKESQLIHHTMSFKMYKYFVPKNRSRTTKYWVSMPCRAADMHRIELIVIAVIAAVFIVEGESKWKFLKPSVFQGRVEWL